MTLQALGPRQEQWLLALESGQYQQCRGFLHQDEGFCCLGVVVEVAPDWSWNREEGSANSWTPESLLGKIQPRGVLPATLMDELGMHGSLGDFGQPGRDQHIMSHHGDEIWSLAGLNDKTRWSFPQIAAWVREDPSRVFKEPK